MLGALISAGTSLASGLLGKKGADKANKQAAQSVREQLAFQKESAQKSYQWAVGDMKKAGINPMLAYQQGGSSALSGANYTPQNAMGAGVNSAIAASRVTAELDNLTEQNKKIASDTQLNEALKKTAQADAALKVSTAQQVQTQTKLIAKDLGRAKVHSAADDTLIGKGTNYLGRWLENLGIKNPSRKTLRK
ncbi:DNA pilot protein [Microviridae sp.]|nr:DNA pilot protein [Microviridae sp.]